MISAPCRFCGQIVMVPDDCTDPVREATSRCNCEAAQYYRHLEDCRAKAKVNVALLIEDNDMIQNFLCRSIDMIGEHFKELSLKDNAGFKYSLKLKQDGTIKVSKSITKTESYE